MSADEVVIDAESPRRGLDLRELWRYRDLWLLLVRRDISVRYRQTALGVLWAVLQPVAQMLIFTIIFGRFARMPSEGIPYSLYAFAALLPWLFFSTAFNSIGSSLVGSGTLITKVYFPRLVAPLAAIGAPCVNLAVSTAFMLLLMAWKGHWPSAQIVWLPLLYLLTAMIAIGVGTLIAALAVAYRDFRNLMQPLILAWMFLTPVIYPPTIVPEQWRWLLQLNPMTGVVGGARSAWFGLPFDLPALAVSISMALLLLFVGLAYFRRAERRFADII